MPKAVDVENLVIHCSAGFGTVESIQKYWKEVLGWKSPGYHFIVDLDGKVHWLLDLNLFANGVAGHNKNSLHGCYIGGVAKNGVDKHGQPLYKGVDTRTNKQKQGLIEGIEECIKWLNENDKDTNENFQVSGHRDFSPDRDGNGIIAPFERIKECPSFDAAKEYERYTSPDRKGLLPTAKKVTLPTFKIYVVKQGDTLSKIAASYSTTVAFIKTANKLLTNLIFVGQKLKV